MSKTPQSSQQTPDDAASPENAQEYHHLSEMYAEYFLDYASYVIKERAVPHLDDGLKPVQRRILHSMKELEDGRYNKVANVVGNTMKYHPHGDSSIGDAMVQLGQKELLIDTQGNWGNVLTGDKAAAPRYIEARLTPFALEVAFHSKTTEWSQSYDGRNKEPVTLPMKFPLLLAQGVEGIAVGLACKMLPHNFVELIDACIAVLQKRPFELLPDFPTGGIMDASRYNNGLRGGKIRVRSRIEIEKKRLLRIKEIPYGVTTGKLMDNIVAANEKNKIKISKIEDNTAANAEILIHLPAGTDPKVARDALFAFTDCEVSISPNACVIHEGKPRFIGVIDILKHSAHQTKDLLKRELEIQLQELQQKWHFSSLEKIFIAKKIYRNIEECKTKGTVITAIDRGLKPYIKHLKRVVTETDIIRLTEIILLKISKYDRTKADKQLMKLECEIEILEKNLRSLTRYTITYFKNLQKKYAHGRERLTEITEFDSVNRTQVLAATENLYVNRQSGLAGWGQKKDTRVEKCSRLDDIIAIDGNGLLQIVKVAEKIFLGEKLQHIAVFRKNEEKIYSLIYRDGRQGATYAKRFRIGGITRGKKYDLTQGHKNSRILYLAVHNSEEESTQNTVIAHLKPMLRLRNLTILCAFDKLSIKNRTTKGNLITKHTVTRISQT